MTYNTTVCTFSAPKATNLAPCLLQEKASDFNLFHFHVSQRDSVALAGLEIVSDPHFHETLSKSSGVQSGQIWNAAVYLASDILKVRGLFIYLVLCTTPVCCVFYAFLNCVECVCFSNYWCWHHPSWFVCVWDQCPLSGPQREQTTLHHQQPHSKWPCALVLTNINMF